MSYNLPDDTQRSQLADMGAPLMCSNPNCDAERNEHCEHKDGECPMCCSMHDDCGACIDCQQQLDEAAASRRADEQYEAGAA